MPITFVKGFCQNLKLFPSLKGAKKCKGVYVSSYFRLPCIHFKKPLRAIHCKVTLHCNCLRHFYLFVVKMLFVEWEYLENSIQSLQIIGYLLLCFVKSASNLMHNLT